MLVTGTVAVGLAAGAALALRPLADAAPLLAWNDPSTVAAGHAIYSSDCAACHGGLGAEAPTADERATLSAPPHDATGHSWQHPDFALFELTKSGEVAALCRSLDGSDMPQFGSDLSDREILAVLAYIKSTWPEEIRSQQEGINALYTAQNAAIRDLVAEGGS